MSQFYEKSLQCGIPFQAYANYGTWSKDFDKQDCTALEEVKMYLSYKYDYVSLKKRLKSVFFKFARFC